MPEKKTYAVIAVGGKQYRVREGEWLLVDRLSVEEGKTFHPDVLLLGGDGEPKLGDKLKGQQVTAKVTAHVLGEKVIVGKHKRRTGYRRRNGHRSRLSRIEIQTIGNTRGRSPSSTPQKESKAPAAKMSTTTAKKSTTTKKEKAAE
ncbi:MAG TPA: 50S ribosomal protein L21 [Gaiellaceae bacterium]|nr:50S ribosomal protein L21 [Gaiellaceae bacterium]